MVQHNGSTAALADVTDPDAMARAVEAALQQGILAREVPLVGWNLSRRFAALTQPLGFTRDTNPDTIGYDIYDAMRRYSTIKAALFLLKAPVLGSVRNATVKCDDPAIKRAVEKHFLENDLLFAVVKSSLTAMDLGAFFGEVVYDVADTMLEADIEDEGTGEKVTETVWDGPMTVIKEVREINPTYVKRILHRWEAKDGKPGDGSFDGFVVDQSAANTNPRNPKQFTFTNEEGQSESGVKIEPVKAFLHTHDKEFGNLWGQPRSRDAYPFYYWAQSIWKYWMLWGEKKASSSRLSRFPEGRTKVNGQWVDNAVIALQTGAALDQMSVVAMPSTKAQQGSNDPAWDIEEFEVTDRSDTFERILIALSKEMLHAMFVPERSFNESTTGVGTFAEVKAQVETFMLTMDTESGSIIKDVNTFLVPRFVVTNFGSDVECIIELPSLSDEKRATVAGAFEALLINPENQAMIDFRQMAEDEGLPLKSVEDLLPEQETLPEEPLPGEEVPPEEGVSAEVPTSSETDTGTPSNLVLSDDDLGVVELWDFGSDITLDYVVRLLNDWPAPSSEVSLAAAKVDLSKYDIQPDSSAVLKYKIINKETGKRVLGKAAANVLKAYQTAPEKERKRQETEAKKAARQQESARKKAETAARVAANKARAAANKAAREQTAAAKKAASDAQKEANRAAAEAKRVAREEAAAERKQKADEAKATREQEKAKRESDRLEKEKARTEFQSNRAEAQRQQAEQSQVISGAKAERTSLEKSIREGKMTTQDAIKHVKSQGWDSQDTAASKHDDAVARAEDLARANPDKIVSVVKVGDGYVVVSKPRDKVKTVAQRPRNVAASDEADDDSLEGYDGSVPDVDTERLWHRSWTALRGIFAAHQDVSDDDPPSSAE